MIRIFTLIVLSVSVVCAKAQNLKPTTKQYQPYGVIDTADLKLTSCDFEKDANAEVLFDVAEMKTDDYDVTTMTRHKRVKIFNDKGKDIADVKLSYVGHYIDEISNVVAETINYENGKIIYTPVAPDQIYIKKINKYLKSVIFSFPNVKSGSVVELKYNWKNLYSRYYPSWAFQSTIPVRFSELIMTLPNMHYITPVIKVRQGFLLDTVELIKQKREIPWHKYTWAMEKVHSFVHEPFMAANNSNIQRVFFKSSFSTWGTVCNLLTEDDDFGKQLNVPLSGERDIIAKADTCKTLSGRVRSLFEFVKSNIAWDKSHQFYTDKGTAKAWGNKKGNSAEINFILYRLLRQDSIEAYPVIASTRSHGEVDPDDANASQFNTSVVCVPVDSLHFYLLDATNKLNVYNEIPYELVNTYALAIDPKTRSNKLFALKSLEPSKQYISINAEIKPGKNLNGTIQITSTGYSKVRYIKQHNDCSEKAYLDSLRQDNKDLEFSDFKIENQNNDTLPLIQSGNFTLKLSSDDDNYIYINPIIYPLVGKNPFLSEDRFSDVDFEFNKNTIISNIYKIPEGYKVDALPKSHTIVIEDKGISLKRICDTEDGQILVRYVIDIKKTLYKKDEYYGLHDFYKKMFEMLNEQIVLKKI